MGMLEFKVGINRDSGKQITLGCTVPFRAMSICTLAYIGELPRCKKGNDGELRQEDLFYFNIRIASLAGSNPFGEEGAHPSY